MKKILIICLTAFLILIVVAAVISIRLDKNKRINITYDDIHQKILLAETIDVCRNIKYKDFDYKSCDDENSELIMSINKDNIYFDKFIDMLLTRFSRKEHVTTTSLLVNEYKLLLRDKNGNPIVGTELGCKYYIYLFDTNYKYEFNGNSKCDELHHELNQYVISHDSGYEEMMKEIISS